MTRTMSIIALVVLLGAACLYFVVLGPGCAQAATSGALYERAAKRELAQARAAYIEAGKVYSATRTYSRRYGSSTGRWTWLARDVGWTWGCIPNLMYIIERESGGQPGAVNPSSGCTGLLQIHPIHGVRNAADPRVNLRAGLRLYREAGWSPWAL